MTVSYPALNFSFLLLAGVMLRRGCAVNSSEVTKMPSSTSSQAFTKSSSIVALVPTNQSTTFFILKDRNQTSTTSQMVTNSILPSRSNVSTIANAASAPTSGNSTQNSTQNSTTEYIALNNATNGTTLDTKTVQRESSSTSALQPSIRTTQISLSSPTSSSFNSSATKPHLSVSAVLVTTTKVVKSSSTEKPLSTTTEHKAFKKKHVSDNLSKSLSSASVAAIVIGFIFLVVILFGGAYYFKIRRPSYGRLLEDGEHRSVGTFLNPMFDG